MPHSCMQYMCGLLQHALTHKHRLLSAVAHKDDSPQHSTVCGMLRREMP